MILNWGRMWSSKGWHWRLRVETSQRVRTAWPPDFLRNSLFNGSTFATSNKYKKEYKYNYIKHLRSSNTFYQIEWRRHTRLDRVDRNVEIISKFWFLAQCFCCTNCTSATCPIDWDVMRASFPSKEQLGQRSVQCHIVGAVWFNHTCNYNTYNIISMCATTTHSNPGMGKFYHA